MGDDALMPSRSALRLGRFPQSGEEYLFDEPTSLITIARPGRGKSQAHVIRNLLYLQAPAFVLDVKPEIHAATAGWRQDNVGPIVKFEPSAGSASAGFNPVDFIPDEPVAAFRFIQRLVPLLMIPPEAGKAKDHWESRAAQLLAAALFDVAVHNPYGHRDMVAVVNWFSPTISELGGIIERLQSSCVNLIQRAGVQLQELAGRGNEKIFLSVQESARRSIDVWSSPELEPLVGVTSFDLAALRRDNGTLYICVTPEELVSYASVVRALFGLALFTIRDARDDWDLPPVTFFLDEFPQLGFMKEVEQMLALGRQSGLRLWLFAQTKGQIREAYGDADRLLEMMAVRCFIEPSGKLAQEISHELGTYRDIWQGKERPLATPQELAGPDYAEKIIVLEGGRQPARLDRVMAFEDPALQERFGAGR